MQDGDGLHTPTSTHAGHMLTFSVTINARVLPTGGGGGYGGKHPVSIGLDVNGSDAHR